MGQAELYTLTSTSLHMIVLNRNEVLEKLEEAP